MKSFYEHFYSNFGVIDFLYGILMATIELVKCYLFQIVKYSSVFLFGFYC